MAGCVMGMEEQEQEVAREGYHHCCSGMQACWNWLVLIRADTHRECGARGVEVEVERNCKTCVLRFSLGRNFEREWTKII